MNYTKIKLERKIKDTVLALGAQSKSSICVAKGEYLYFIDIGKDLGELVNLGLFKKNISSILKSLNTKPKTIACDMHPEYASTRLAEELANDMGITLKKIQHHKAHIASSIIDNSIKGNVIGIAFDGTGYGEDGLIWGGEFFVGNLKGFKRAAHLDYIPMPGGEKAILEPWRMGYAYVYSVYKNKAGELKLNFLKNINNDTLDIVAQAIDKKINSPITSSMGRLFDAVSSIIGVCSIAGYEAEPAIKLEKKIQEATSGKFQVAGKRYRFNIKKEKDVYIIKADNVIKSIIRDVKNKVAQGEIAFKFHIAVAAMIKDICNILRKSYKINKVVLSGGVFKNNFLKREMPILLENNGFKVYLHNNIPTHDSGISVGQAVLATRSGWLGCAFGAQQNKTRLSKFLLL